MSNVAVVTDSNTMIPPSLVSTLSITVVPLTFTIGGDELTEDASLDVADAYRRLRAGERATTSAPSPGSFMAAYRALSNDPVVSVHIGAAYSGTINAARLGARLVDADVTIVDTGTVSFLAGCCAVAAAEAAREGAGVEGVVAAAERTASSVASVFTIAELDRARAGGRLDVGGGDGAPLLHMDRDGITTIAYVSTADEAAMAMLEHVGTLLSPMRIGVGDADAGPVVDDLVARLRLMRPTDDVVRYVVGPTIAAHAGMGTFGLVYHPLAGPGR